MGMAKKKETLRDMTTDELRSKEREFSDQMFRLKFQLASGQSDVLQKLRELKKEIARVKTVLRENELQAGKAKTA
jgi:large subunit ribosomal protein L29